MPCWLLHEKKKCLVLSHLSGIKVTSGFLALVILSDSNCFPLSCSGPSFLYYPDRWRSRYDSASCECPCLPLRCVVACYYSSPGSTSRSDWSCPVSDSLWTATSECVLASLRSLEWYRGYCPTASRGPSVDCSSATMFLSPHWGRLNRLACC